MSNEWVARIGGPPHHVAQFVKWLPSDEVRSFLTPAGMFLTGTMFDAVKTHEEARRLTQELIDSTYRRLSSHVPDLEKPIVEEVTGIGADGRSVGLLFGRNEWSSNFWDAGPSADALSRSAVEPQTVLPDDWRRSVRNEHLLAAAVVWLDPPRSWPRLYRILEEVELGLGCRVDEAGLCTGAERETFTRCANTAEVAGPDARHASGRFSAPARPISLSEAETFAGSLLAAAVRNMAGTV